MVESKKGVVRALCKHEPTGIALYLLVIHELLLNALRKKETHVQHFVATVGIQLSHLPIPLLILPGKSASHFFFGK